MKTHFSKWLPAIMMMLVIYWFSAQSAAEMPTFDWADSVIKKGGHVVGYGLLALSYWRALQFNEDRRWIAWLLALVYAMTDEFHQAFVPGRGPSVWDVIIFDNLGALIFLWLMNHYRKEKRPARIHPLAEEAKR